jgi:hypothetical protein
MGWMGRGGALGAGGAAIATGSTGIVTGSWPVMPPVGWASREAATAIARTAFVAARSIAEGSAESCGSPELRAAVETAGIKDAGGGEAAGAGEGRADAAAGVGEGFACDLALDPVRSVDGNPDPAVANGDAPAGCAHKTTSRSTPRKNPATAPPTRSIPGSGRLRASTSWCVIAVVGHPPTKHVAWSLTTLRGYPR